MTEQTSRRRGRHDIVVEILKIAKNGEKKTRIMSKACLSFTQIEKYLNALRNGDFITVESAIWKTTEKGLHVLEACDLCSRLIEEAP